MAGRNAKPIELHMIEGKKHLTKEEIGERQAQENSLKSHISKYLPSDKVMRSPIALRMFKKLKKLYKEIEYVEGLDENIINRYCLLISEADEIEERIINLNSLIEECNEDSDRIGYYKLITSSEITLNKINDMLLKLEDRLFLNPTSRVKNVPKKSKEKEPSEFDRRFGNV